MLDFSKIYKDVSEHLNGICETAYPEDRPDSVQEKVESFLVISIPSLIDMPIVGSDSFNTSMEIELFIRDKSTKNSPNLVKTGLSNNVLQEVFSKFPHGFDGFKIGKPTVMFINKSDGKGFHYSMMQMQISTI